MTQVGCYVFFVVFRFFSRSLQLSGSVSKLAFFEAFPLWSKKQLMKFLKKKRHKKVQELNSVAASIHSHQNH